MLASACSFIAEVSCHCFTLHVSAYMAIFRCVECYYSNVLEGICFAGFSLYLARGYTFVRFHMCFPVLFFSFYFAVSCVRVYLLVFSCCSLKTWAQNKHVLSICGRSACITLE
jgi:hypothetical protein